MLSDSTEALKLLNAGLKNGGFILRFETPPEGPIVGTLPGT